jgi:hypothetical protein
MLKSILTVLCTLYFVRTESIIDESTHKITVPSFFGIPLPWTGFHRSYLNNMNYLASTWITSVRPELLLNIAALPNNQSTGCEHDLEILINATVKRELWALKVFDAWGKPLPSGLLNGNIFWIGNYDECVNPLYQENNRSFVRQPIDTQYCMLTFIRMVLVEITKFCFRL